MSTQNGFHVLLGIPGDLLKLVDSHQTGLVGSFEVGEQLLQRHFRPANLPDTDVEYGLSGDGIELESRTQGGDSRENPSANFRPLGFSVSKMCLPSMNTNSLSEPVA